jgi:hypothetical protein
MAGGCTPKACVCRCDKRRKQSISGLQTVLHAQRRSERGNGDVFLIPCSMAMEVVLIIKRHVGYIYDYVLLPTADPGNTECTLKRLYLHLR